MSYEPQGFHIDRTADCGRRHGGFAPADPAVVSRYRPWVKNGSVGKTTQSSSCPDIEWENEDYDLRDFKCDWAQESHKLAPLDPTDHPLHPYFKGNYSAGTNPIPQPTKP